MLRVPSDPNKENITTRRGRGCIADKGKQSCCKVPPANKNGPREVISQKKPILRIRAKSSNDGNYQACTRGATKEILKCKVPKKPVVLESSITFDIFNEENCANHNDIKSTLLFAPVESEVRRHHSCSSVTEGKKYVSSQPQPVIRKKENCDKNQKHVDRKQATQTRNVNVKYITDKSEAGSGDIYNEEYVEDIIRNIKVKEKEIVLKNNFLKNHNPDEKCRAGVLNWLLKKQTHLKFFQCEYYLAVHFLDNVLAVAHVSPKMYQLVVITSLWIAMKLNDAGTGLATAFVDCCERDHSTQQLIKMERKILRILEFKVHTTEPSIFMCYYLRPFGLQDNTPVMLSVYHILDCLSLIPEFSSTKVTILVAASVKYTLSCYGVERDKINTYFETILCKEEMNMVRYVQTLIYMQLKNMDDENYIFKQPRLKYRRAMRQ